MGSNERRMRGLAVVLAMVLWIVGFAMINASNEIVSRAEEAYATAERAREAARSDSWWPFD